MRLYIVFGDHTEKLSEHLAARYEIAGKDRTLEAAVAAAPAGQPDALLVLGTALASNLVDGRINWGAALVRNLTDLRRACPKSRIITVLPSSAGDSLVQEIIHLGIYDVHCADRVKVKDLVDFIDNPRTFADVSPATETFRGPAEAGAGSEERRGQVKPQAVAIDDLDSGRNLEEITEPASGAKKSTSALFKNISSISSRIKLYRSTGEKRPETNTKKPAAAKKKNNRFKFNAPKINDSGRHLTVAVVSPWMPNIGTTLLAVNLAVQMDANLLDADLGGRGVGLRLGIPPSDIWEYDWRDGANPVILNKNRYAWTLDPHVEKDSPDLAQPMQDIIRAAKTGASLIIDAGSDPLAWYAQAAIDASDVICFVADADPLHLARALPRWRRDFVPARPAVMAQLGEQENIFGLETVKIKEPSGNLAALIDALTSAARNTGAPAQATVYLAGAFGPVEVEGINCVTFRDSFQLWKALEEQGLPDGLIFQAHPGIEQFIGELCRQYPQVPVAVVGETDEKYYDCGADACYGSLTPECVRDLLARAVKTRKIHEKAIVDELTGCHRKEALETYIQAEMRRFRNTGEPFSVLICDLDHFKKINDTYGHLAGDQVLREFGSFLRSNLRDTDKVIRYGGEEFVVIFARCGADSAYQVADKLRSKWSTVEHEVTEGKKLSITFSGGLTTVKDSNQTVKELLEAADGALYQAKEAGRNRIVLADCKRVS